MMRQRENTLRKNQRRWFLRTILLLLACLLLVACGDRETTPTLIPMPTLAATEVSVLPAPTATESAPAAGEAQVTLPPPPTTALLATNTPIPETPTPTLTPTPTAIMLLMAEDFGDDRNPLTGELVEDPELLQRRPIAVKISNSPAEYTRPQSGLNDADWVFEHITEGLITRFTAILYGTTPPNIGPIRSARLIDLELPAIFDAGLAFSGASAGVTQRLNRSDFTQRIIRAAEYGYYRTGADKPYEHTLYGRPEGFWEGLEEMGQNRPPKFGTTLAFHSEPPPGGETTDTVTIEYQRTLVEWRYDPEIGRYRRWADGEEHHDANTDEQVTAANVIIIRPFHINDPTICEEVRNGVCQALSVQIQLWGTGNGIVLRDGQRYDVIWQRLNRNDLLTFVDSEGEPFPLQIGNTWVQVVPQWLNDPVTVRP